MTLTCVSGYWKIKNKHDNKFENWFNNTLKFNCPYVFFSDKETIEQAALMLEGVQTFIEGKDVRKIIVVPNKIVNVVI